ncbi:MAG: ECF transporter S component [Candidatus Bathyarchaeales archaeon]
MFHKLGVKKIGTREIAASSLLGGLSALWEIIPGPPFDIPFPLYPRISWDITGIPMIMALLLYGPLCAIYTCFIGCSIIFFRGNVPGGTFKLLAELATIIGYAILRKSFIVDMAKATASRVIVMTIANYYLLQFFYRLAPNFVAGLLLPIAIFNVSQALINIIPAYAIYVKIVRQKIK